MGTKQSSLAKSASTETNEETPKLEVELSGERGLMIVNPNIIEVSSEEEFDTESDTDSDDDSEESDDEEGVYSYSCFHLCLHLLVCNALLGCFYMCDMFVFILF